jgi:hypothetical protein
MRTAAACVCKHPATKTLPWLRTGTAQQLRSAIWQRTTARQRSQSTMASGASAPPPAAAATGGARTALDEMAASGEFVRKDSTYRQWIKKGTDLEPEGGAMGGRRWAAGRGRGGVRSAGEGMT